ncbi:MAG TPA: hypothetical protein PKN45_08020 [Candidatus Limiplasma sp.]|nr:hypothetical protein [Candidatus Limiplasma sp.]
MGNRMGLQNAAIHKHAFLRSVIALCCTLIMVIVMMPLAAHARSSEGTMVPGRHRSSYRLLQLADYVLQTASDNKKLRKPIGTANADGADTNGEKNGYLLLTAPERSLIAKEFNPAYHKRRVGSSE